MLLLNVRGLKRASTVRYDPLSRSGIAWISAERNRYSKLMIYDISGEVSVQEA